MSSRGTGKFIAQRGTAVIMLPLLVWFVIGLVAHAGADRAAMQAWLTQPVNGILMAGLVILGAMHMRIGMNEIIEDYIHGGLSAPLQILNWVAALGIAAIAGFSALSLVF